MSSSSLTSVGQARACLRLVTNCRHSRRPAEEEEEEQRKGKEKENYKIINNKSIF